jgi:hypothetical protein
MTIQISTEDARSVKALSLLANASQWLKMRTPDGRKFYGVPASQPGKYYSVDTHGCDCPDRLHRLERGEGGPCKHQMAVMLYVARINGARTRRPARTRQPKATAAAAPVPALSKPLTYRDLFPGEAD